MKTTALNPPMVHPGPVNPKRIEAVGVQAYDLEIQLEAGQQVEAAICSAVAAAGCDGAWVDVSGLFSDPYAFVMPDKSPDGTRVAWYSETYEPKGETRVDMGGMSVGHYGDGSFTHCHGVWTSVDGTTLGHMLAPICTVSRPVTLKAVGFKGGRFERLQDDETCFELFRACATGAPVQTPDAVILTLRPNTDLCGAIEETARAFGISDGEIMGLGSANGARFQDAPPMHSAITEFIISSGKLVNGKASVNLSAVDIQKDIFSGTVKSGDAPISITAEIVLRRA
ncbi:DUF296 domain-containing protein [Falsihalocynthiibacter arcticus]|uniref:DUF296 domain-containing protein n=1 Tax=Falsihalocynthiibacter arcticus TaxID=1579316 RepID=A0A126UYN5_9RHOB|nr:DUF296 domain-containing protein [Falsihalocynthiibacter arcticus]AML51171.1 hypothetical protein RC74_07780 [Falsihalocynthiibacter arcticus]